MRLIKVQMLHRTWAREQYAKILGDLVIDRRIVTQIEWFKLWLSLRNLNHEVFDIVFSESCTFQIKIFQSALKLDKFDNGRIHLLWNLDTAQWQLSDFSLILLLLFYLGQDLVPDSAI